MLRRWDIVVAEPREGKSAPAAPDEDSLVSSVAVLGKTLELPYQVCSDGFEKPERRVA